MKGKPAVRLVFGTSLLAVLLAGCGAQQRSESQQTTVGKYGDYGAETMTVEKARSADDRVCRTDADSFASGAHSLVMHFGSTAASSTDVYYILLREQLADLDAHGCQAALLGTALVEHLTAGERRALGSEMPRAMASRVHEAVASARQAER